MKRTVAELIGPLQNYNVGGATPRMERMKEPSIIKSFERVFTVSLVVNAHEAEIMDDKVVIEKRVIAFSHREALDKFGITGKD